jgi:hypothetical protein
MLSAMNPAAARLSVVATLTFLASTAAAQSAADRATARELGLEGQDAMARKDYVTAEDRFRRADALYHAPTLLLGYARAEAGLGKLVNASEAYNRILREGAGPQASTAFQGAVDAAKAEVDAVRARIATVTVTVTGPDAPSVTLDGQPLPVAALGVRRPVDPGEHTVDATADGWEAAETKFTVGEAGSAVASLALKPSAPVPAPAAAANPTPSVVPAPAEMGADQGRVAEVHPGRGQRTLGWVAVAVGGAGVATGAIAGVLALGKHSTLANECPGGACAPGYSSDVSSYNTLGTISTVGFIVGAALAGTGLVLVLSAPRGSETTVGGYVAPFIGFGTVGAAGSF